MESTWKQDRAVVAHACGEFAVAIEAALLNGGIPPALTRGLQLAERLGTEFVDEPDQMGAGIASIWQDRALSVARYWETEINALTGSSRLLAEVAVQLAAIVFQTARRLGGERRNCDFGYGFIYAHAEVRDGGAKIDLDVYSFGFDLDEMLAFIKFRTNAIFAATPRLARPHARGRTTDPAPCQERQGGLVEAAIRLRHAIAIAYDGEREFAAATPETVQRIKEFDAARAALEEKEASS